LQSLTQIAFGNFFYPQNAKSNMPHLRVVAYLFCMQVPAKSCVKTSDVFETSDVWLQKAASLLLLKGAIDFYLPFLSSA
jgi:hypothetical protein